MYNAVLQFQTIKVCCTDQYQIIYIRARTISIWSRSKTKYSGQICCLGLIFICSCLQCTILFLSYHSRVYDGQNILCEPRWPLIELWLFLLNVFASFCEPQWALPYSCQSVAKYSAGLFCEKFRAEFSASNRVSHENAYSIQVFPSRRIMYLLNCKFSQFSFSLSMDCKDQ